MPRMFDAACFLIAVRHIGVQIDTREVAQGNGPAIRGREEAPDPFASPNADRGTKKRVKPSQQFSRTIKLPREHIYSRMRTGQRGRGTPGIASPNADPEKGGKPSRLPPSINSAGRASNKELL